MSSWSEKNPVEQTLTIFGWVIVAIVLIVLGTKLVAYIHYARSPEGRKIAQWRMEQSRNEQKERDARALLKLSRKIRQKERQERFGTGW